MVGGYSYFAKYLNTYVYIIIYIYTYVCIYVYVTYVDVFFFTCNFNMYLSFFQRNFVCENIECINTENWLNIPMVPG